MGNDKLMLEAAALIAELRAENHQLRQELTKARGSDPAFPNTVAGKIAETIHKDNAARRAQAITKTSSESDLHPHFVNDARNLREARKCADLDRIAKDGANTTLEALRKRAGGR